jgi:UDP-N-acetylmuramoyl-L-alanyl-D-glutamate--2,6-diaminopimelate ligase
VQYTYKTDDVRKELNQVCDLFNGRPSSKLTVFGTTGTNGKSTISSIISDIYSTYKPCGYMGTIAVRYGEVTASYQA